MTRQLHIENNGVLKIFNTISESILFCMILIITIGYGSFTAFAQTNDEWQKYVWTSDDGFTYKIISYWPSGKDKRYVGVIDAKEFYWIIPFMDYTDYKLPMYKNNHGYSYFVAPKDLKGINCTVHNCNGDYTL